MKPSKALQAEGPGLRVQGVTVPLVILLAKEQKSSAGRAPAPRLPREVGKYLEFLTAWLSVC